MSRNSFKKLAAAGAMLVCVVFNCIGQHKTDKQIKEDIRRHYIEMCADLNKQMPMMVDEITSIKCVAFTDYTMTTYYSVDLDVSDFEPKELTELMSALREDKKAEIPRMFATDAYKISQQDLYGFLKFSGLKFRFVYHDINSRILGAIEFDYKDFKPQD